MSDPHRVLDDAREALARTKQEETKAPARVLLRFEQKIRLTESALTKSRVGATRAGLCDVLARAEARAASRPPTTAQEQALEVLRAAVARVDGSGETDDSKLAALVKSLAADTERVQALLSPKSKKVAAKKGKKKRER